jgi:crotonobetainyl-CoA:carnitine CoA-transferase CaiB-like acyl-CoA transferase
MERVLDGVKVLELAQYGFVPSAAAVLADWGADVIKVEQLGGDPLRQLGGWGLGLYNEGFDSLVEQLNRNKRSVTLDLSLPEARPIFERLLSWADVFITSYLPRVRAKLRTNPDDVWAVNPRLVYARGQGHGVRGPDADVAGYDSVSFWARGSVAHMLTEEGASLVGQRGGMGDIPSGTYLAGGVAAALYRRDRTGRGLVVDVALLGSAVWWMAPDLVLTSTTGQDPPRPSASTTAARTNPLTGAYRVKDGRWIVLNMMDFERYWPAFARAIDHPEMAEDPRWTAGEQRAAQAGELRAIIVSTLASQSIDHWRERLAAEGCVWAPVNTPSEVLADPAVDANGFLLRHPGHPTAQLCGSPVQFGEEPVELRRTAPGVGQHTDEVLAELGIGSDEVAKLRECGAVG